MTVGLLLAYMALGAALYLCAIGALAALGLILGTLPWRFG